MLSNSNRLSPVRTKRKTSAQRRLGQYDTLEPRQMLATMIAGTQETDSVIVTYVEQGVVDIQINDELMEAVDISEGLRINLKNGLADSVQLDSRIAAEVVVVNAESLELTDGETAQNNDWQIGFIPNQNTGGSSPFLAIEGIVAGRINSNITFAGAKSLSGTGGADTFTINTNFEYGLTVFGGDGDDLFRFTDNIDNLSVVYSDALRTIGHGEGGNDHFIFRGQTTASGFGAEGVDRLDYQQMEQDVFVFYDVENETVIGSDGFQNTFTSQYAEAAHQLAWTIDGNMTTIRDTDSNESVELINFSQFAGDNLSFDRFWILETTQDIKIENADWIQVSSELDATQGNLDTIEHDIEFARTSPLSIANSGHQGSTIRAYAEDKYSTYHQPVVVISDATGTGLNATMGEDQTITGLTAGSVQFMDRFMESCPGCLPPTEGSDGDLPVAFTPNIIIHGSHSEADQFLIESAWSPTKIFSHGGDDTFLFGSTNEDANGSLEAIKEEVSVFAGEGLDQLFAHDQAFDLREVGYQITGTAIQDLTEGFAENPTDPPAGPFAAHFARINFNGGLESVQINGSNTQRNTFRVTPTPATGFTVDSSAQEDADDLLTVFGFDDVRQLSEADGNGRWTFGSLAKSVDFFGVETTTAESNG